MIEEERDTAFYLNDALIKFNLLTDSLFMSDRDGENAVRKDTLVIDKSIYLDNVHFQNPIFGRANTLRPGYLVNIYFIIAKDIFAKKLKIVIIFITRSWLA